jgi:phage tail sheath protein FI
MPVAPTYPGVYIEEVPSGVQTLVGVATSITSFIGFTPRGPVDRGVRIQSWEDFERKFGGLSTDSALSYAVRHFYANGGSDAYVVRVALGARAASATLMNGAGGVDVLRLTANAEGAWGNLVRIDVDYASANPESLFNLTVTRYGKNDSAETVVERVESYRNLSMNSYAPTYAETTVNAGSEIVRAERLPAALGAVAAGTSTSGPLAVADFDLGAGPGALNRVQVSVDGLGPWEIELFPKNGPPLVAAADNLAARQQKLGNAIVAGVAATGQATVTRTANANGTLTITSGLAMASPLKERSGVRFLDAARDSAAARLHLGLANGGTETDGAAAMRPAQTGTTSGALGRATDALPGTPANGAVTVEVMKGATNAASASPKLLIWGPGTGTPAVAKPATVGEFVNAFQAALQRPSAPAELRGATVSLVGRSIRVVPPPDDPNVWYRFANATNPANTTATDLLLVPANATMNLAAYAPGQGVVDVAFAQNAVVGGADGSLPDLAQYLGDAVRKTGIFALEDVDLFNLMCLPGVTDSLPAASSLAVLSAALEYCKRRRAFLIVNLPAITDTLDEATKWLDDNASLRERNVAAYFPQIRALDPIMGVVRAFDASGAIAGIYARTDSERGVWKAPAGTTATIAGTTGVTTILTDGQNGVLNPLGLNCLRSLDVFGQVVWGARTLRGADQLTDEYKYVPIRRLALFLEESLYRGTQWVVFEPNDEPLWAQIRLNLGAFMHNLFTLGAFQGRTPREAYFVKCDGDTTTQNDRDLGRVNIIVGFAPLKPAEFVIIKIQQIAGNIQT